MNNNLVLHAIILKKPKFKTKQQAFNKANNQFPEEHLKGFVRETNSSFRVRVVPKTKFNKTTFVSKILSPNETLVWGTLKK